MNLKSNQVLSGLIILLIGVLALVYNFFGTGFGSLPLLIAGGAFLLLYRTKRKSWSLMLGVLFAYTGFTRLFPAVSAHINSAAMFFIIPAIIFLILFFDKNKKGLLLPGMVLLWFGMFLIINGLPFAGAVPFSPLPACMGVAFMLTFAFGRGAVKRFWLYAGLILFILGGVPRFDVRPAFSFLSGFPALVPVIVIVIGAVVIVRAVIKK